MAARRLLLVLVFCLTACGYATNVDPVIFHTESPRAAELAAKLHARDIGGHAGRNECCGSMEPLIVVGDWLITKSVPFTDKLKGRVVVYRPLWFNSQPVAHRFVSGNARDGFIASGDNNPKSESREPVTEAIFVGEVIAIYKPSQK